MGFQNLTFSLRKYFISLILFFAASTACAESFVEFFIIDKIWPDHKWGHVSLRVKDERQDITFDFGRYGQMWGFLNTEGAPVLRVWRNSASTHMKFQKTGATRVHTIRFSATPRQAHAVLAFYNRLIGSRKPYGIENGAEFYNLGEPAFHSLHNNCTTLSIAAFMAGYPSYNVNHPAYARAHGLYWWARSQAVTIDYDQDYDRWSYIWWPNDLLLLLQREYVKRGLASEKYY